MFAQVQQAMKAMDTSYRGGEVHPVLHPHVLAAFFVDRIPKELLGVPI